MDYQPVVPAHVAAVRGLQAKLREAIRSAWIDGKDFAHGPFELGGDSPFSTKSLFDEWRMEVTCKAGPIEREFDGSGRVIEFRDLTYYRRPDFSDMELLRFTDGRHDWRDEDWQDHCGLPGCEQCQCHETIPFEQL